MRFFVHLAFFIFGAVLGSFANVLIYRLPRKKSIVYPGSHCPTCKTSLQWIDNIPLISYVLLKGRCRYCQKKISVRYFLVELFSALIFLMSAIYYDRLIAAMIAAIFFYFLMVASIIDARHFIIPDALSLTFLVFSSALLLSSGFLFPGLLPLVGKKGIMAGLSGSTMLLAFFLLVDTLSRLAFKKQGIGAGDIKLGLSIGIYTGNYSFLAPLFGYLLMAFLYPLVKPHVRDGYLPFGPFLSAGAVLTVFAGEALIKWYLKALF